MFAPSHRGSRPLLLLSARALKGAACMAGRCHSGTGRVATNGGVCSRGGRYISPRFLLGRHPPVSTQTALPPRTNFGSSQERPVAIFCDILLLVAGALRGWRALAEHPELNRTPGGIHLNVRREDDALQPADFDRPRPPGPSAKKRSRPVSVSSSMPITQPLRGQAGL